MWHDANYFGAALGVILHRELAPHQTRTLFHGVEAQPAGIRLDDSRAIITNPQLQVGWRFHDHNLDALRAAVLERVLHRLLRNAVKVAGGGLIVDQQTFRADHRTFDAAFVGDAVTEVFQRLGKAIRAGGNRIKFVGQIARLCERDRQLITKLPRGFRMR